MDEVPDNEKIAGETEFLEDAQFVIEALVQFGRALSVAAAKSLLAQFAQVSFAAFALGRVEHREARLAEIHGHIAPLRDAHRVGQRRGVVGKNFRHFLRRLEVKLRQVTQPPLVGHVRSRANANHHVVRLVVGALEEVDVVGRNQTEPEILAPAHKVRIHLPLRIHPVVVDLEEKIILPENLAVLPGQFASPLRIGVEDRAADLAFEAAAQSDEALGVTRQQLFVHARLVIKSLEVRGTD